jgi:hypothetical protein
VKFLTDRNLSTHSLSVEQQLQLAEVMHQLPAVVRVIALVVPEAGGIQNARRMLRLRAYGAAAQIRRHVYQMILTHRAEWWR